MCFAEDLQLARLCHERSLKDVVFKAGTVAAFISAGMQSSSCSMPS